MTKRNLDGVWLLAPSAATLALHGAWLSVSTKWTSPQLFFSIFSGTLLGLLLVTSGIARCRRLPLFLLNAMACAFIASGIAWVVTDALIAPQRLSHYPASLPDFAIEILVITTFTGAWLAGIIQAFVFVALRASVRRSKDEPT